jgi:hypothetical protein
MEERILSELEKRMPGLVAEGIQHFLCTAPHHGEFWGYDVRRMAWLKAAQEGVEFLEEYLLHARCFKNRFELLDFALSQVEVKDGLFLEFGVFKGETIEYIANRVEAKVYGFDSFKGLPENWEQLMPKGAFYTFGKVPESAQSNIQFVKGWFSETIPPFVEEHDKPCAFVHVDCDLYSSTCDILNGLSEQIIPGTIIVFDEFYNFPGWRRHEFKAFSAFLERRALNCEYLGYVGPGCQVAVRVV